MADNYPNFQFSFFLEEEKNSPQVVVRGDDYQQFVLDVEAVKKQFGIPSPKVKQDAIVEDLVDSQTPLMDLPDEPFAEEPPHPADQVTVKEIVRIIETPAEEEYWVNESHTEKNPGRHFKVGKKSKKFLGWTEEPLTPRKP